MPSRDRTLAREVEAVLVPYGNRFTLPAGTTVALMQTLGGSFTIMGDFGMARLDGQYADAIGEQTLLTPASARSPQAAGLAPAGDGPPDSELVWAQLRCVYDPEIPVNIVDLGLVYSMDVKPREGGGHRVEVSMTLTAPGCGMGPAIAEDAKLKVMQVPGVSEADVQLVWDPPWNQDMISEEGKMKLGLI
jgi:probable FeS assembly SUF system protein SufT